MRGGRRDLVPRLRWRGSLLECLQIIWFCWLQRITSCGLYRPLQISCCSCCKSLRILADGSRSFSICFSESLQIHADLRRSICRGAVIWVPNLPSSSDVSNLFGKYGGVRWVFFHWCGSVWRCQLAAACRGGSCSRGCHGYLPALCHKKLASP